MQQFLASAAVAVESDGQSQSQRESFVRRLRVRAVCALAHRFVLPVCAVGWRGSVAVVGVAARLLARESKS